MAAIPESARLFMSGLIERARKLRKTIAFPEGGLWQRLDGGAMTTEDWDDPAGEGFRHVCSDWCLTINRAARLVICTDPSDQPGATETDWPFIQEGP